MRFDTLYRIFSNIPTLRSERIILRKIKISDAQDMFEYSSDPRVSKYLLWKPHPNIEYTKDHISYLTKEYRIGKFYDWAIVLKDGSNKNKMIGTCGFTSFDLNNNCAEVGYVLNPKFWGYEIADEALREIIRYGFEELLLHRIEAKYIIGNTGSRRVMEKCGMHFEGVRRSSMIVKNEYRDIGVCSLISDEYYKEKNKLEPQKIIEYREIK